MKERTEKAGNGKARAIARWRINCRNLKEDRNTLITLYVFECRSIRN